VSATPRGKSCAGPQDAQQVKLFTTTWVQLISGKDITAKKDKSIESKRAWELPHKETARNLKDKTSFRTAQEQNKQFRIKMVEDQKIKVIRHGLYSDNVGN